MGMPITRYSKASWTFLQAKANPSRMSFSSKRVKMGCVFQRRKAAKQTGVAPTPVVDRCSSTLGNQDKRWPPLQLPLQRLRAAKEVASNPLLPSKAVASNPLLPSKAVASPTGIPKAMAARERARVGERAVAKVAGTQMQVIFLANLPTPWVAKVDLFLG